MEDKAYLEIIEGMLYLAGDEGLDYRQVANILAVDKKKATTLLDTLTDMYQHRELKGLEIVNYGGKYKIATKPNHYVYFQKMVEQTSASLSNAALETLAIIAYNQPITRTRIEDIRGVGCDSMIRKLQAKALIKDVGREESLGMPILYGVTDEFMDAFSLATLDELPELGDIVEIEEDEELFHTKYREIAEEK